MHSDLCQLRASDVLFQHLIELGFGDSLTTVPLFSCFVVFIPAILVAPSDFQELTQFAVGFPIIASGIHTGAVIHIVDKQTFFPIETSRLSHVSIVQQADQFALPIRPHTIV